MNKFYLQCHLTVVLVKEGNSGERVRGGKPDKKKERMGKHDTDQVKADCAGEDSGSESSRKNVKKNVDEKT
jgi:hypothetical protein